MIRNAVHADEIAGMDTDETEEHFKNRHNTYEVLEKLRDDKWIRYNKNDKTFPITPGGRTAKVMFELRDLKNEKGM